MINGLSLLQFRLDSYKRMSQEDQWKWIITAILLVIVGLLPNSSGTQVKGGIGGGSWQGGGGSWQSGGGGGSWKGGGGGGRWQGGGGGGRWQGGGGGGRWQGGGGGGSWQGGSDGYPNNNAGVWKDEIRTFPKTSFKCSNQPYVPGYYADVETQCKVSPRKQ
ncbi:putative glycine-rich cell wall structural protein 1 isoform X1 [Limulus polyphemus]|uniref:Glycine-rich cell wall structural protein 1 isoform X1 n=2 Tax=Limulus polyphemus TaxID=6850 RepID=A0ABM1SUY3_LIMPO|nr:putative glycine-rich cell wall structural protein 1 isoform X1 [Limulus polyphemus]